MSMEEFMKKKQVYYYESSLHKGAFLLNAAHLYKYQRFLLSVH